MAHAHGGHGAQHAAAGHAPAGLKVMYWVWTWLLIITMVEVALAYFHVPPLMMLVALIGMSLVKAALIVSYFMHLKFERVSLVYTLVPAMIGTMLLMNTIFPDAKRLSLQAIFR
jgi:cytochrome c oxidase subunit 4